MSRRRRKPTGPRPATPPPLELPLNELTAIVERTKSAPLSPDDHARLKAAMDTLAFVTAELQATGTSLNRLRRLLFGAPTEKTRTIVGSGAAPEPRIVRVVSVFGPKSRRRRRSSEVPFACSSAVTNASVSIAAFSVAWSCALNVALARSRIAPSSSQFSSRGGGIDGRGPALFRRRRLMGSASPARDSPARAGSPGPL